MPAELPDAGSSPRPAPAAPDLDDVDGLGGGRGATRPEGGRAAELPGIGRLMALSDGVVAIALTLLVLQLHVPVTSALRDADSPAQLASRLRPDADQLVGYVIAFYVIAQFWLAHHRLFRQMTGHHEGLAWCNFAFLFAITLMPFTSDLMGQYTSNPLAVDIFAFNLLLASLASLSTLFYAVRRGLLSPTANRAFIRAGLVRSTSLIVAVVLSMGIAWISTDAAKYCWLLILVLPLVVRRRLSATEGNGG